MNIAHLMASPFYGGPEKQMLGLARGLPAEYRSVFLTFVERGKAQALLDEVVRHGFEGVALRHNTPNFAAAVCEVAAHLERLKADVLVCSGYKPDIIGFFAARRVGIPVVSVAHGWTAATWKVRLNELVDRFAMRWMDKVICVSQAQAAKVRKAGVPGEKVVVIHNAVNDEAFASPDPAYKQKLHDFFKQPFRYIVGAAGRLSPEKGFDQLITAASLVSADTGFIIFGDGPLRETLTSQIAANGLQDRFILAGFHADVGKYFPYLNVFALPSYTEGLPVALLEAMAAGTPVLATRVGGVPEVIDDGHCGYLVLPRNPQALAARIRDVLVSGIAPVFAARGPAVVRERFTAAAQSQRYQRVFDEVCRPSRRADTPRLALQRIGQQCSKSRYSAN